MHFKSVTPALILLVILIAPQATSFAQQVADTLFTPTVGAPVFKEGRGPAVLFDEAHSNSHTGNGTYKPFVSLITTDGYNVTSNKNEFSAKALEGYNLLVISNARGSDPKYNPAFTEKECSVVESWVREGGNLLLIADHYPFGFASRNLSERFGISMSGGFTNDSLHCDSTSITSSPLDGTSQLVFSRANGLIPNHPITQGRNSDERINRIIAFTGQSLKGPQDAMPFLNLASSAYDIVPDSIWQTPDKRTKTRFSDPISAAGRAQGIALTFGKGRVVILGEAAMLTAQRSDNERFGMQVSGIDNRQLALNIMHWLSRVL